MDNLKKLSCKYTNKMINKLTGQKFIDFDPQIDETPFDLNDQNY